MLGHMATASLFCSICAADRGGGGGGKKALFLAAQNAIAQSRCALCNAYFSPVGPFTHPVRYYTFGTNMVHQWKPNQHGNGSLSYPTGRFCFSSTHSVNPLALLWRDGFNRVNVDKGRPTSIGFPRASSTASQSALTDAPKVSRPSVTWGVIQNQEQQLQARERVFEYLKSEGINTSQLTEIELPSTVEVVKERLAFLRKIGLDNQAINNYPLMIGCSIKKNMIPVLGYLEKLGIERKFLPGFLKKYPMVLHASVVIDLLPVVDYLKGLDIDKKDIANVLLRFPDVLGFKLEGTMSTSVAYLVSIGVSMKEIGPILTEYPEILGMRVASVIKPKVDYLISLGLPKSIVARILERRPQLLGYDLNETMRPAVDELLRIGVQKERIPGIVTQYPEILGQRLGRILDAKVEWLTKVVKVSLDNVPGVIEKLPQVLSINEKLAMERISFLQKFGFSIKDAAKMIADCPQILALSVDQALKPNLDFLQRDMGRNRKELVEFPSFFTYSLETRIRPRYRLVAEKGIKCSLAWFLNCSDQRFKERMEAEFVDDKDSTAVFKMGGPLPVGLRKYGKEWLDADKKRLLDQKTHAREGVDLDRMNPFIGKCESADEEDEDEKYNLDEESEADSDLLPQEDETELSEPSASGSWEDENGFSEEGEAHHFFEEADAIGD